MNMHTVMHIGHTAFFAMYASKHEYLLERDYPAA
jgi:hypothetical protein